MTDEDELFHDLREGFHRERRHNLHLDEAVIREHEELHEGPIRYCHHRTCLAVSRTSAARAG